MSPTNGQDQGVLPAATTFMAAEEPEPGILPPTAMFLAEGAEPDTNDDINAEASHGIHPIGQVSNAAGPLTSTYGPSSPRVMPSSPPVYPAQAPTLEVARSLQAATLLVSAVKALRVTADAQLEHQQRLLELLRLTYDAIHGTCVLINDVKDSIKISLGMDLVDHQGDGTMSSGPSLSNSTSSLPVPDTAVHAPADDSLRTYAP